MARLEEWEKYDEVSRPAERPVAVEGIRRVQVRVEMQDEDGAVHTISRQSYTHVAVQEEQEVLRDADGVRPSGKRRMRLLLWAGMEQYDDFAPTEPAVDSAKEE